MKHPFLLMLLFSFLSAATGTAICPVGDSPADSSVFVEHNGEKVYFCCAGCIPAFKADPEAYLAKIAVRPAEQKETTGPVEVVFQIFGMDCPGCHGGVEKLLKRIDGVKKAKANYLKQEVYLELEPGKVLDEAAVMKAIESANFTAGKRVK